MGNLDKEKTQRQSLWTTTLEDMDSVDLPTQQDIDKAIKDTKENNININESDSRVIKEINRLKKIFETNPNN